MTQVWAVTVEADGGVGRFLGANATRVGAIGRAFCYMRPGSLSCRHKLVDAQPSRIEWRDHYEYLIVERQELGP